MLIVGLNKTTLLDYPGRVAATVFTGGCNFRCPFCHNGHLVLKPSALEAYSEEEVFSFLHKRRNVLKGVCITGGEPTLQPDLPDFIRQVKSLGYCVKLDTNGYEPEALEKLLEEKLLDYVAMDIKNCRGKYPGTVGLEKLAIEKIDKSIMLLRESGIDYEFRTTVVKEFHTKEDLIEIGNWLSDCPKWFLQQYRDNENVIGTIAANGENTLDLHAYNKEELKEIAEELSCLSGLEGKVFLRGID